MRRVLSRLRALVLAIAFFFVALGAAIAPAAATAIERVVSPGGIEAWLVSEPSVPLISVRFAFRGAGAAYDPDGREGLSGLAAAMLDEGAGPYDSEAFQDRLADLSVRLSFASGIDVFAGTLQTLSARKAEAFELLRLALNEPRFDPDPLRRMRESLLLALAQKREDPDWIAMEAWRTAAFAGHPYAKGGDGTEAGLTATTAGDLARFVATRLARDALTLGVVGDITAAELAPLLDAVFAGLPARAPVHALAEAVPAGSGTVRLLERAIPQSVVVIGGPGLKRDDPDFYAAYVMNEILGGGGLTSRLSEEVREKRGLAYGVYTYLYPLDHAGLYLARVATQNARLAESLAVIGGEMARMRSEGVSAEELAFAKSQITGSFPLRFDSNARIAEFLVSVQLDGLGIDYIEQRNRLIEAVTPADIVRVSRRLLDPARMSVLVVGDPDPPPAESFAGG